MRELDHMASTRALVSRLNKVLQRWHVDPSRKGRDLGEFLNHEYKHSFKQIAEADPTRGLTIVQSLERLNSNHYRQLYKRKKDYSFSGDVLLKNPGILSNENLAELKKERTSKFGLFLQTYWRKRDST